MRSPLSIDHQNEAAASSSTFKGNFGSSPQSNVFQGLVHALLGILRLLQGSTRSLRFVYYWMSLALYTLILS